MSTEIEVLTKRLKKLKEQLKVSKNPHAQIILTKEMHIIKKRIKAVIDS